MLKSIAVELATSTAFDEPPSFVRHEMDRSQVSADVRKFTDPMLWHLFSHSPYECLRVDAQRELMRRGVKW
jgi:hypothetical protein